MKFSRSLKVRKFKSKMELMELPQRCEIKTVQAPDNRRVVFGPPLCLLGFRPPISCELYITNLPINLNVHFFFGWLNRIGAVYEMRLMINPEKNETRGYGFVRYFEEKSAIRASELLSFLFLSGKRPSAQPSQCKRQLYVGNIPKTLSLAELEAGFRNIFPTLINCKPYPAALSEVDGVQNRGFAFLEFIEHDNALEAKKYLKSTRVWNQHLKVDWARPNEHETDENAQRMKAFGALKKNDYCAKLRLYSLANNCCIPIVVYGNNFRQYEVQYGGVLLKDPLKGHYSIIIVEVVGISRVFDTHLLICEVATHLTECVCGMPGKNYVVRVRNGCTAKILFSFNELEQLRDFKLSHKVFVSTASVIELFSSLELLAQYQSETILNHYKVSFRTKIAAVQRVARFSLIEGCPRSYFYSIFPKFRDNYPLNNDLNDTEIVLILGIATSDITFRIPIEIFDEIIGSSCPDEGAFVLKSQRYNCHPNYKLEYVDIGMLLQCSFYHPSQRLNTPPLWVCGDTYQSNLFQSPKRN